MTVRCDLSLHSRRFGTWLQVALEWDVARLQRREEREPTWGVWSHLRFECYRHGVLCCAKLLAAASHVSEMVTVYTTNQPTA